MNPRLSCRTAENNSLYLCFLREDQEEIQGGYARDMMHLGRLEDDEPEGKHSTGQVF